MYARAHTDTHHMHDMMWVAIYTGHVSTASISKLQYRLVLYVPVYNGLIVIKCRNTVRRFITPV